MKELYCARKKGLSANKATRTYIFSGKGLGYLGVATEYNLYTSIEYIDVYTEFEILKFRLPIIFRHGGFFATQG